MKSKIEKIVLNVNGKKIELSTDEAKELKGILMDLFGGIETKVVHEYQPWPYQRWYPYSYTYTGFSGTLTGNTSIYSYPNQSSDTVYLSTSSVGELQNV